MHIFIIIYIYAEEEEERICKRYKRTSEWMNDEWVNELINIQADIFSLPMLIPSSDCKIHKRCPGLGMYRLCPGYTQCKPNEGLIMHIGAKK